MTGGVDTDDHPLGRALQHRSVRALALERPALRRPAGYRTVEAPAALGRRDPGFATGMSVPGRQEPDRRDEGDHENRQQYPDPGRRLVVRAGARGRRRRPGRMICRVVVCSTVEVVTIVVGSVSVSVVVAVVVVSAAWTFPTTANASTRPAARQPARPASCSGFRTRSTYATGRNPSIPDSMSVALPGTPRVRVALRAGTISAHDRSHPEGCPSGRRSAIGNRVCAERCIEGSNPSLRFKRKPAARGLSRPKRCDTMRALEKWPSG